jgi:hypothetical protein
MKKRLLLSLTALVALTASAQKGTDATSRLTETSVYNSNSVTVTPKDVNNTSKSSASQKSLTNITDTCSVTNAKWAIANASGGSYKLAAYPTAGGTDYLSAVQKFPLVGSMDVSSLGLFIKGNSSTTPGTGSGDIFIVDKTGLVGSTSFSADNDYSTIWVDFTSPLTVTDTFTIYVQPASETDSISLVHSGDVSALGVNSFNGLLNVYSEDGSGTQTGNANYGLADNGSSYVDADWQMYPVVSHSINTVATADITCLTPTSLDVTFDFAGADSSIILNPIFNVNAFMIEYLGQSVANNRYYADIDYMTEMDGDTLDVATSGSDFYFMHTFAAAVDNDVVLTQHFKSWGWTSTAAYMSSAQLGLTGIVDPTFTAISSFCSGTTAPSLEATSNETITGAWSPATIDNTTVGTATYTFTPDAGQCANNATLDVTVNDCASLEENAASAFTLFPNPANDVVTVSLANSTDGNITLLSADGKIVESREVSSSVETFNVKSLNSGVYFFKVGQTIQKLMVK